MLKAEAHWLARRLSLWPTDLGVILNVGSSDRHFRTRIQPWIDETVFEPARARGMKIVNQDLFPGVGVDIAGDLLSERCQAELRKLHICGIVCSNVLEHVFDRCVFADALRNLLSPSGRALITVPFDFPHHPDPIDVGYRPNVKELLCLFPDFVAIQGEILSCGRIANLILDNPGRLVAKRIDSQHDEHQKGKKLKDWLPYLVRSFKITCVEIQRQSS